MIESHNDQLFNRIKYFVGFSRSKRFKFWFHQQYPGKEMHHIFGSYGSKKTSDFCSVPVTMEEHQAAHKKTHDFAIDHVPEMLSVMTDYINHLESKIK